MLALSHAISCTRRTGPFEDEEGYDNPGTGDCQQQRQD
jgi:hypothetical protein